MNVFKDDSEESMELKHSVSRTLKINGKRRPEATSCLLPTSRMLLLQRRPMPRLMSGAEALALQGIPMADILGAEGMNDSLFQSLAGNAFSGGCCAAVMLSTLLSVAWPRDCH